MESNIERESNKLDLTYRQRLGEVAVKSLAFSLPIAVVLGSVLWIKGDDFASAGATRLQPSVESAGDKLDASLQESRDELERKLDEALEKVNEASIQLALIQEAVDEFLSSLDFETTPTTIDEG